MNLCCVLFSPHNDATGVLPDSETENKSFGFHLNCTMILNDFLRKIPSTVGRPDKNVWCVTFSPRITLLICLIRKKANIRDE
jgi:hypothetical protein